MSSEIFNFSFLTFHLPDLLAMGQPPQPGDDPMRSTMKSVLLMVIPMLLIFYVMGVRPQKKQQDELKKMLDSVKIGDRVLTTGGILGLVSQVKEKTVIVKIAENTKIELVRSGIQQILKDDGKEEKKG